MKQTALLLITIAIILLYVPPIAKVDAATQMFSITANSGGTGANQGNFSPGSITVDENDTIEITFSVPASDPYCCGIQIKGNGGEFDTGTISPGGSKTVSFTATNSFTFTSYWPATSTVKATGTVTVTQAPDPPSTPTGFQVSTISSSQIQLSWNSASGATSYEIYRNNSLLTTQSTLSFINSGLQSSTTYCYKVRAKNNVGSSAFTSEKCATTSSGQSQSSSSSANSQTNTSSSIESEASAETNDSSESDSSESESSSSSGSSSSSSSSASSDNSLFVDETQSYTTVNGVSYSFTYLPEIKQGDIFSIFGRTVAFADIEIVIESDPIVFTTTADNEGWWSVEIDTESLPGGSHTFQTYITAEGKTRTLDKVEFRVQGDGPSSNASSADTSGEGSSLLRTALIWGSPVLLVGLVVLIIYYRRSKKGLLSPTTPQSSEGAVADQGPAMPQQENMPPTSADPPAPQSTPPENSGASVS